MSKKIAASVMAFNRPEYLKPVMRSFEAAAEAQDIDWYVFLDNRINKFSNIEYAKLGDINAVYQLIMDSTLPIKEIIRNTHNEGIALQKHKAHQLFNDYDLVFFFEDDLVIGKYYLRLLRVLAKSYPGCVGMMNRHYNSGPVDGVSVYNIARLWGYYMTSEVWSKIEIDWNIYYDRIKNYDYRIRKKKQDLYLGKMLLKNSVRKLWPCVTRGTYVGKFGSSAYKTEEFWKRRKMHRQPAKIEHPEDATIGKFRIVTC